MKIEDLKGVEITSVSQLKNALHPDGQGSGTLEGNILIDGNSVFVRKHWSYSGGFPFTSDNLNGEILLDGGNCYCEGRYQDVYNELGVPTNSDAVTLSVILK